MRGIVRPCRTSLGEPLFLRWQAHLCGLCLTLRDTTGQAERVLTGYDALLLSVLVEAQAGHVATTTASPCPLRGFSRATVVASSGDGARLAAAGSLLSAGAGLVDKLDDDDLARPVRRPARRIAARLARSGSVLAAGVGLDARPVLTAPARSAAAECAADQGLAALLDPTGAAVAALFAHTAVVAGTPDNAPALASCGQAFGALVHLLDAVDDRAADRAAGRFNPLEATGTDDTAARAFADRRVAEVAAALDRAELADPGLVDVLLRRELVRAVHRALPATAACGAVPRQRTATGALAAVTALWSLVAPAVIVGGSFGSGGCGGRRRRPYDSHAYGSRSVGPGCGQLLACNCCANLACNACCCGSECASS